MTDGKPSPADVLEFVGRGVRAQTAVDAIAITALVKAIREHVDAARAYNAAHAWRRRERELNAAMLELDALGAGLAAHFERFAK